MRLAVVGSFQRNGDRVRITARVVDVVSGEAVADAKVDGPLDEIFELQDQVAAQFAARARASPARDARRRAAHAARPPSLEAYRAFMEGWLRLETLDVRELPRAIADFERAIAIDRALRARLDRLASAEFASYESTRCRERAGAAICSTARSRTRGRPCSSTTRWPKRTPRWR